MLLPLPRPRCRALRLAFLLASVFLLVSARLLAQAVVRGIVVDPAGAPVAAAAVTAQSDGWTGEGRTDTTGRFAISVPSDAALVLVVRAPAFDEARLSIAPGRLDDPVRVEMPLPALAERVTVTAARAHETIASTPASVAVVSSEALDASPALVLDDTLRQVPGFTLFRRSSSLTANPTSQGVSLRGLGASGASRALVLDDGVPLNDPFGGWVYWDRLPASLLDRVEIVRGGASDLYGSAAVSGVVNLVRRQAPAPFARASVWAGSMGTGRVDASGGFTPGAWQIVGGGEWLRTHGYVPTAPEERGAVDTPAASRHGAADLSAARRIGTTTRAFARVSLFAESRANGTPLQVNDTRNAQVVVGGDGGWLGGELSVRGYGSRQKFNQTFSSIAADRSREALVRRQQVPSSAGGGSIQWVRRASRHRFMVGAEGRRVRGTNHEQSWSPSLAWRPLPDAGGTQSGTGVFAADTVDLGFLSLLVSARGDRWQSGSRTETAFSPRLGGTWRATERVTLIGTAYRAFRAPTLNELYRSFRLGNVVTLANDQLGPERVTGLEAGARVAWSRSLLISGRVFAMRLDGAVANITLSAAPSLIVRQRENLGRLASRGVELDAEARVTAEVSLRAGYLFDDAVVSRFAVDPALEGRWVPQQPHHAVTTGVVYRSRTIGRVALDARWSGSQFDDDQNRYRLASCSTMGASWTRAIGGHLELLAAAENFSRARCEVAKTPATQLGSPPAVRLGTRVTWR